MKNHTVIGVYDKESSVYSQKRYDGIADSYVRYFFRKRLDILIEYIKQALVGREQSSLLEVGCADGIVIREIDKKFPGKFREVVGVDIAPKMIDEAGIQNKKEYITYHVRDNDLRGTYDFILEVGFLGATSFAEEFSFVKNHLRDDGYFICSLAGIHSLHSKIKLSNKNKDYFKDYLAYGEYEKLLQEHFEIIRKEPYGLFIPKLWAAPSLARVVQPLFEGIFKYVAPGLFHEKIYVLKKKPV